MTAATLTPGDVRLRRDVERALEREPAVDASAVGIAAYGGAITLTGFVGTCAEKLAAERAATHVRGVRAVANDITVRLLVARTDADIAADAVAALTTRSLFAAGIQAAVHHGHVTLTGAVKWLYQLRRVENAIRHVAGARGVFNHVVVIPESGAHDVRRRIARALPRNADIDAQHIVVPVDGETVTLKDTVGSWSLRDTMERTAGSAPGIARIDNQIGVVPAEPHAAHDGGMQDEMC